MNLPILGDGQNISWCDANLANLIYLLKILLIVTCFRHIKS